MRHFKDFDTQLSGRTRTKTQLELADSKQRVQVKNRIGAAERHNQEQSQRHKQQHTTTPANQSHVSQAVLLFAVVNVALIKHKMSPTEDDVNKTVKSVNTHNGLS